ncbi:hypothetical protein [Geobacter argillaceus]|uniref:hypothetical protein n=1 Tax=Geobacter argillaceus TaxID=345631 RepID=UPI00119D39D7|nr:hypothetical protein [Geobacter argillaceus]
MKLKYFEIPKDVVAETERAITAGNHEIFAIWTAPLTTEEEVCKVKRCVIPKQTPGQTTFGVYVHIEGKELSRIQFDNFDRKERSVIQLHTHPSANVWMSELDREWEVVRHIGALSIIVPFYGKNGIKGFPGVNVYERETNDWRLWSQDEVLARLRFT